MPSSFPIAEVKPLASPLSRCVHEAKSSTSPNSRHMRNPKSSTTPLFFHAHEAESSTVRDSFHRSRSHGAKRGPWMISLCLGKHHDLVNWEYAQPHLPCRLKNPPRTPIRSIPRPKLERIRHRGGFRGTKSGSWRILGRPQTRRLFASWEYAQPHLLHHPKILHEPQLDDGRACISPLFLHDAVHFPRIPASVRTRARNRSKCTTVCSKTAEVHAEKRARRTI